MYVCVFVFSWGSWERVVRDYMTLLRLLSKTPPSRTVATSHTCMEIQMPFLTPAVGSSSVSAL